MTPEEKKSISIGSREVCAVYNALYQRGLVSFVLTEEAKNTVAAIVHNINGSFFGADNYRSAEQKAVAFLYFIIKDHPFIDGNKRVATLVFGIFCELNKITPRYENFSLDELAVFIERHRPNNHRDFVDKLVTLLFLRR